jgi:RNA polymerase sigma-54 factor
MKNVLRMAVGQHTAMTPQLLQSIRLLHLTAQQVELEVARALEENPLLEMVDEDKDEGNEGVAADEAAAVDEVRADDATPADDFSDFMPGEFPVAIACGDLDPFENVRSGDTGGVRGGIRSQLELEFDDANYFAIACWLLDHTADTGYLELPVAELREAAASHFGVAAGTVEAIRQRILRCDPVGFAACDLRECLLVQLAELGSHNRVTRLAMRIVDAHLETLALHDNEKLAALLGATRGAVDAAVALVLTLEAKPGSRADENDCDAIVPDVVVRRRGGGWHVALNARAAPRVFVSPETERLVEQSGNASGAKNMRDLLQEARWLTRGLSMRYDTLLKTTRMIVERQAAFFEGGEEFMRPLILREVAAAIGMHESSISRITTGKYMQTPRGTFELKYFFSARLEGAQVAGVAVRAMVKRLIATESRTAPLADDTIVALLARRGVRIARRTVAKYRDVMRIASAKERYVPLRPGGLDATAFA